MEVLGRDEADSSFLTKPVIKYLENGKKPGFKPVFRVLIRKPGQKTGFSYYIRIFRILKTGYPVFYDPDIIPSRSSSTRIWQELRNGRNVFFAG